MKIKYCVLLVFIMSSALMAVDVNWTGPITFTPANPVVGDNVIIKARFTVMNGSVQNLMLTGTIDGNTVYSKIYPSIIGPKSMIITVNWTAAHSTKMMRLQGQPSNVKVEFKFNSKIPITTNANSIEATIPVKDAPPTLGIGQDASRKKPDFKLEPCIENANGTTDLVPVEFSFNKTGYSNFTYKIVYKNIGPRCLKNVRFKITYPYSGVDTLYKEFLHSAGADGWAIKAGETRTQTGTFQKNQIPEQAYTKDIDSQLQEITYEINFKLILDPNNEQVETNEGNNIKLNNLTWVED